MLYREGAAYDTAIDYFQRALDADPENVEFEQQLAGTFSRSGNLTGTETHMMRLLTRVTDDQRAVAQFSFGVMVSPLAPNHSTAKRMMVDAVTSSPSRQPKPSNFGYKDCVSGEDKWTVALGLGQSQAALLEDLYSRTDRIETPVIGGADFDLSFFDKRTVHAMFQNAIVEGPSALIVSKCEVIAYLDINSNLPSDFLPTAIPITNVRGDTLYLLHSKMSNYYHLVAEILTRLAAVVDSGISSALTKVLTVDAANAPLLHDFANVLAKLTSFNMDFWQANSILPYEIGKRYSFERLHVVSWTHALDDLTHPDIDLWDSFLPSKAGAQTLQRLALDMVATARERNVSPLPPKLRRGKLPKVIYASRTGIRSVENEEILFERLQEHGDIFDFHVFASPPSPKNMPSASIQSRMLYQMDIFSDADVIIGPHGAGLTNIVFARNASLFEFTMTPQCNRCFGFLAAALGHDYYAVNEVTSRYLGTYTMTDEAAAAIEQRVLELFPQPGPHDEL
eukprot:m.206062 g.206062  ORF g.206062 m.206062 type:complete len:508 (-) comp16901_c0_seq1:304-1827(-)